MSSLTRCMGQPGSNHFLSNLGVKIKQAMGISRNRHDFSLREMPLLVRELHIAVMDNDPDTVLSLVDRGVNINFPWSNPSNPSLKDGSTPLICAVSLNHMEIVHLLISAGAYINKCDRNGCTPVFKAAFHGRSVLIDILSRAGADVNLADFAGKTPLYICVHNAIVHSCKVAVQKLLKAGAIVDKCDKIGEGPVHLAARWKLAEVLLMLLSFRGNTNLVDRKGRTPLYICVSSLSTKLYVEDLRHQLPIILVLFSSGADMMNLTEWLLYKGPGVPEDMLQEAGPEFTQWYRSQISTPQTLKNICRKCIQQRIISHGYVPEIATKLPLPHTLQNFMSRKMFFRENQFHIYSDSPT